MTCHVLLENTSGFCNASWPSLQTPEGFTRHPDGFQKPSSVSQGLCGMGNLEAFWNRELSVCNTVQLKTKCWCLFVQPCYNQCGCYRLCHFQSRPNTVFTLPFSSEISIEVSLPNRPFDNFLSIVANFRVLNRDSFLSPLVLLGWSLRSVSSCHLFCVVIKQTVKSSPVSARITAGLNLLPERSVKGKVINTISPLAIINFLQVINGINIFFLIQEFKGLTIFYNFLKPMSKLFFFILLEQKGDKVGNLLKFVCRKFLNCLNSSFYGSISRHWNSFLKFRTSFPVMEVVCLITCNYPYHLPTGKKIKTLPSSAWQRTAVIRIRHRIKKTLQGFAMLYGHCSKRLKVLQGCNPLEACRPDGFRKPWSVSRGLCVKGNLEAFSTWRDGKPWSVLKEGGTSRRFIVGQQLPQYPFRWLISNANHSSESNQH